MANKEVGQSKIEKEMYEGGGARKCMHGYLCQLNLCALTLLRVYRSGYTFLIGSEDSKIRDFDDLILKYKAEDGIIDIGLYFQSKHIQNCGDKALTAGHLLNGETESKWKEERFLLSKYYESYLKNEIRSDDNHLSYFIIYTNMGLDIEDLSKAGVDVVKLSSGNTRRFIHVNSQGDTNCYRLSVDKMHPLFKKFYTLSDAYKVAIELVDRIKDQDPLQVKNDVLRKYKYFIGSRLLEKSSDDERIRRFTDDFISCQHLAEFRIFRNVFKKVYYEVIKPNYEFECENAFQEDLKTRTVRVSRSFLNFVDQTVPEFPDPSKSILNFFDELVLAVRQPNVIELDEIIKREIEDIFSLKDTGLIAPVIKSKMLDWMKEKTGTWLTRDDATSFIQYIKQNMEALMIRGISLDFQNELCRKNCNIKTEKLDRDSTVQAIKEFLNEDFGIMLIPSNQSLLSLLKVHQGIIWIKEKDGLKCLEKDDELIFLPFASITSSDVIINDLKDKNTYNILVTWIQESFLYESSSHECLKDLLDSIVSKKRRMIMVFQETLSNKIYEIVKDFNKGLVFDNPNITPDKSFPFLYLDEKSQYHLLELEVVDFQGKLTNLLSFSPEIKNIIDEETILCLVNKSHVHVGKLDREIDFSDRYISRILSMKGNTPNVSDEATPPKKISEDELLSNDFGKVLIISGEPRSGKRWLLSSLSEKLKVKYPNIWVLNIDLKNYSESLGRMAHNMTSDEQCPYAEDSDKAVEFITENVLMAPPKAVIASKFEKAVLKLGFTGKIKLALLIHGFSELCKEGRSFLRKLLMGIKKTKIEFLFITTRPEMNNDLECLEAMFFSLDSFANYEDLRLLMLNCTVRLPENLDIIKGLNQNLMDFLTDRCSSTKLKTTLPIIKNVVEPITKEFLSRELCRATDGKYPSASSPRDLINSISYIIKKKLDVTAHLE